MQARPRRWPTRWPSCKGHCPGCEHIFIPKRVAWELLREKLDTKTETAFGRKIKVVAQNAPLRHVNAEYKHPEWRHGLDWCPPLAMKRGSGKDQGRIRHLDNTPPPLLPGMPGIPGIVAASGERHSPLRPDARGRRGADARHPRVQWTPHDRPRGRRAVTLGALLCTLHRAGVRLRVEGPRLLYVGPRQTLTQALLTTLRARKPELLALLAGPVRGLPDPLRQEWWPSAMFLACAELEVALTACGADHARERAFWATDREMNTLCWEMNRRVEGTRAWPQDEAWAVVWEDGVAAEAADAAVIVLTETVLFEPPEPEAPTGAERATQTPASAGGGPRA